MQYLLTGSEMSACDARTSEVIGIPSLVLMERAALSTADAADRYLTKAGKKRGRILVMGGRGNNGADGLAAGRILLDRGYKVDFFRLAGDISPGSSFGVQEGILKHYGAPVRVFSEELRDKSFFSADPAPSRFWGTGPASSQTGRGPADGGLFREGIQYSPDVIIDGLFGTGLSRDLEGPAAAAVSFINQCRDSLGSYVIAVDIPSGISSDDGSVRGCAVRCDETTTFAFLKRGHLLYPGASFAGDCHLEDIGITSRSFAGRPGMFTMSGESARDLLPRRDPGGNKGTFGKVLIAAGQKNMCGAAILCARACLSSGAGMVRIFTHESNRLIIQQQVPEALLETWSEEDTPQAFSARLRSSLDWADIAAAGPGMGRGEASREILRIILEYGQASLRGLVLDADAIRILAEDRDLWNALAGRRPGLPCILTPHLGEFAALAGKSIKECSVNRAGLVREMAQALACTLVCKDARTLAAPPMKDPGAMLYLNCSGNSGMATAGSGDVLTGMTAAYLAAFRLSPGREREGTSFSGRDGDDDEIRAFLHGPGSEAGFDAAVCAVYLHGRAGDLARSLCGERGMTAGDLVDSLRMPGFWQ